MAIDRGADSGHDRGKRGPGQGARDAEPGAEYRGGDGGSGARDDLNNRQPESAATILVADRGGRG
jgi:hypothetical protein